MKLFAIKNFSRDEILPEVDLTGFSQFDQGQIKALDSHYASKGRGVTYNGTAMVVMISDGPRLMIDQLGEQTKVTEAVTVMVRRYGTPKVELPLVGDLLVLNDAGVEKRYKLNVMPASAFSHLEWKLEFSRTITKSRGGTQVLPYGG